MKIKNCKQFLQKAEADWNIRAFPVGSVLLLFKNSNKEVQGMNNTALRAEVQSANNTHGFCKRGT
ncbi:MAG: hypothetical protein K1W16_07715 [Lachnospiraceae bacterium]